MFLITAPPPHRRLVHGLPDLYQTRSADAAFVLVKLKTGVVPVQAEMCDQFSRLFLGVLNQFLVNDIQYSPRHDLVPIRHQILVGTIRAAEFMEVPGEASVTSEGCYETGNAGIERVSPTVNNSCFRQHQVNDSSQRIIEWQLVGYP